MIERKVDLLRLDSGPNWARPIIPPKNPRKRLVPDIPNPMDPLPKRLPVPVEPAKIPREPVPAGDSSKMFYE